VELVLDLGATSEPALRCGFALTATQEERAVKQFEPVFFLVWVRPRFTH
jgi:hypothetical protein